MEKVTENYLITRIKELEKKNSELFKGLNDRIVAFNLLTKELEDLRELKKFFIVDNEEPRRIACVNVDGGIAGTIAWEGYDDEKYAQLKNILESNDEQR